MKTIIISAGHSLSDPGAVYNGSRESFMTMELTKLVSDIMRKHSVGILNVPDELDLKQTIAWVNVRDKEQDIDAAIEIHTNASTDPGAKGVEAWYYHDFGTGLGSEYSKKLAQMMVDGIGVETGMKIRGVFDESTNRWGKLGFVHDTTPLASLVECGFLSNETDRNILLSPEGRMNIAKGICRGLLLYIGEEWKPELLNPDQPQTESQCEKDLRELKESHVAMQKNFDYKLAEVKRECQAKADVLVEVAGKLKAYVQQIRA